MTKIFRSDIFKMMGPEVIAVVIVTLLVTWVFKDVPSSEENLQTTTDLKTKQEAQLDVLKVREVAEDINTRAATLAAINGEDITLTDITRVSQAYQGSGYEVYQTGEQYMVANSNVRVIFTSAEIDELFTSRETTQETVGENLVQTP